MLTFYIIHILSFFYFFLILPFPILFFFFFNDTATTEIYTLSLHDALPICLLTWHGWWMSRHAHAMRSDVQRRVASDRKSTRLNSSHLVISYAVFCLKKKKKKKKMLNMICVERGKRK